jgi:hypothetical protein
VVILVSLANWAQATRVVLDNVPHYEYWYGCTPTAAGSLMAYWDSQPGFENLYKKGDAQVWSGSLTAGTKRMVASLGHLINGPPDSLAGFLGTSLAGGTNTGDIVDGLKGFAEWDDTSSYDIKDGYEALISQEQAWFGWFEDYKAEIDAGRPVLLSMSTGSKGHSVIGYGYDEDITFSIWDEWACQSITVPGFAVMDTGIEGSGEYSQWIEAWANGQKVFTEEYFDPAGVEWWPWVGSSLYQGGEHWQVKFSYPFELVPEPTTILLFGFGVIFLRKRH